MKLPQNTNVGRRCAAAVRSRLRERLVDSSYRLLRTGLPPKPYDGTDAAVVGVTEPPPSDESESADSE